VSDYYENCLNLKMIVSDSCCFVSASSWSTRA